VKKPIAIVQMLLVGLVAATAGCSNDTTANPPAGPLVIRGRITDGALPIAQARVNASSAAEDGADTTDASGNFEIELATLVDSLEVCAAATGYRDTCAQVVLPPDTLLLDLALAGIRLDTVWLSADTALAGDTAEVTLYLSNPDSAVAGLNHWIRSASPQITFDTVFLTSPRFPVSGMEWAVARHDSINAIAILIVDFQGSVFIPPGRGPLMRLRYTVAPGQGPGSFTLDTTSAVVARPIDISYRSGRSAPDVVFLPGRVVVQ
jgi:hypothetical protein